MQVNRKDLLDSLNKTKPGICSKERVSQANCFVFNGGDVVTYNEHVLVMYPSPLDINGAVRAEELLGVLNKLTTEMVDVSFDEGHFVIKAGRAKSAIRFDPEIKLPIEEAQTAYEGTEMFPMPVGLLDAMDKARFCASQSMTNLALTGLHIKGGRITSTDGYRIFQINVPKAKKLPEFLLPAACVDSLKQYEITKIGICASWAFFIDADDLLFCVRLIDLNHGGEAYPEVSSFLEIDGKPLTLPAAMLDAIDKTSVFTKTAVNEMEKIVEVALKPGRVIVRGEGTHGWHEESVLAKDYTGDSLDFCTHPDFLKAILPHVTSAILGERNILFEGDGFKHTFVLSNKKRG